MHLIRLQQHRSKVERIRSLEYKNDRPCLAIIMRCNLIISKIDKAIADLSQPRNLHVDQAFCEIFKLHGL